MEGGDSYDLTTVKSLAGSRAPRVLQDHAQPWLDLSSGGKCRVDNFRNWGRYDGGSSQCGNPKHREKHLDWCRYGAEKLARGLA